MISISGMTDPIKAPASNHQPLINAQNTLKNILKCDHKCPDLAEMLKGPTSDQYAKHVDSSEQEFVKSDYVQLPESLSDQIDHLECRCFMGVLPEINYAWMTVDHRLFLWNYETGKDIYTYEDQDQIICSVGLVKPKPDVFGSHINYVLVVTTPLQVIVLAMSYTAAREGEPCRVTLFATDMSVSSDDVQLGQIAGTDDGRIFMVGDNGHLYELDYRHPDTWFGPQCKLLCRTSSAFTHYLPTIFRTATPDANAKSLAIDNERKVLYILKKNNSIEVIYLGDPKNNFLPAAKNTDIGNSARLMCRQNSMMYDATEFELQSIHVISKMESNRIHLLGVTNKGFRLYFTHEQSAVRFMSVSDSSTDRRPNVLELVHVRVPPPVNTQTNGTTMPQMLLPVHASYYDCGIFVAARSMSEDKDSIIMTARELGEVVHQQTTTGIMMMGQRSGFVENSSSVECDEGKIWAIVETNVANRGQRHMNEITEPLTRASRQFLILTNTALLFYKKQRPVDVLHQLLLKSHGDLDANRQEFRSFFECYGQIQACAMCLNIICASFALHMPEQENVIRGATRLFFECEEKLFRKENQIISSNHLAKAVAPPATGYSSKHDGFVLYFARLLSPVWEKEIFQANFDQKSNEHYTRLQKSLIDVKYELEKLKKFMDLNSSFHMSADLLDSRFQSVDRDTIQSRLNEQQSLHELYLLLAQSIEAISFIDFLIDAGVQEILQCVPEESKNEVFKLTLENMLTSPQGRVLSRELVIAAINKYGTTYTHVGFDVVSDLLQRRCSSFFGPTDVAFYKGMENVRRAQKAETDFERTSALSESLTFFKEAAEYVTDEKLARVCMEYRHQGYHVGAVELALECANKFDPQQQGLAYAEGRQAPSDPRLTFYNIRVACYDRVFDTLMEAKMLRDGTLQHPKVVNPSNYAAEVFAKALASQDKLFHYSLYAWLRHNGLKSELLAVDTAYLIPFFNDCVDPMEAKEFLWQYYRRRENYYEAALCLEKLAKDSSNLKLTKRVEYLALAVVNARCRDSKHQRRQEATELLQNLEEHVEVARIQVRLHQILPSCGPEGDRISQSLDDRLASITELFMIAKEFNVYDEVLYIMKIADHYDLPYLQQVWKAIIEQNELIAQKEAISPFALLKPKIVHLAERLYPSKFVFPVDIVIQILESYCFQHRDAIQVGFVANALLCAGIPVDILEDAYITDLESKRPPWRSEEECEYLLSQINYIKSL
ncbi:Non-repetitive/WGA-negative nucleoporin C-terminal-domain-containing protein [Radiomyces spectabilis]|uniref:Non-repetitive/WGA-negative nucleoporin C-terminal-domain-containing protein n=1 Tax=Radiomyces spectabilis TaxID=64574 RepID=UPI0022202B3A|nr:Non-repetitive/WGA-negative nucleoporin C-terminal-domain-containing protein [Radiomyces spectabilis]KAI8368163.1 Non-repetitive/WGA-negative nucleoporin C-terminal-domain-containing protein [Radiomyces spectabilis]